MTNEPALPVTSENEEDWRSCWAGPAWRAARCPRPSCQRAKRCRPKPEGRNYRCLMMTGYERHVLERRIREAAQRRLDEILAGYPLRKRQRMLEAARKLVSEWNNPERPAFTPDSRSIAKSVRRRGASGAPEPTGIRSNIGDRDT